MLKNVMEKTILVFHEFKNFFNIEFDASNLAVGDILSQEGWQIAFFCEKLKESKRKYSSYFMELYFVV